MLAGRGSYIAPAALPCFGSTAQTTTPAVRGAAASVADSGTRKGNNEQQRRYTQIASRTRTNAQTTLFAPARSAVGVGCKRGTGAIDRCASAERHLDRKLTPHAIQRRSATRDDSALTLVSPLLPQIPSAFNMAASSSSSSSSAPENVDALLRDLAALERTAEVSRITSAFKLNPIDILNVSHQATKDEIAKAYRAASLQVHPDKFPAGPARDKAQQAFTMLAAAKDELMDDAKREAIDALVDQARQRVFTNHASTDGRKKRKVTSDTAPGAAAASSSSAAAAADSSSAAAASSSVSDDDPSTHPEFDLWVRNEMKEILIEREWRKRQLLKAAAAEEALAAEAKAKRAADKEARDADTKQWEDNRDSRINSWRNFQKGGLKSKVGKLRVPKMFTEDADNSFVRRPVAHQSSEK